LTFQLGISIDAHSTIWRKENCTETSEFDNALQIPESSHMTKRLLILAVLFLTAFSALADEPNHSDSPALKSNGIYGTLFGDPGINLFGVDYAYWSGTRVRWNAGIGTIFFANTMGVGVNYYLSDSLPFRPFIGTGLNLLEVSDFHDSSLYGRVNTTVFYQNLKGGVEYAAENGFFIDLHVAAFLFYSGDPDHRLFFNPIPALAIGSYF
jgi:hypothetical protein